MNARLVLVDLLSISPMLILLFFALVLLLVESFAENVSKKIAAYLTLFGLVAALIATIYSPVSQNPLLTDWLKFDSLSRLFTQFFIIIGIGATLLSKAFFKKFPATGGEYFFLLLSSILGLIFISYAADFLTLFLGLETLSISLYVLCGYMKKWTLSSEAAIKYFFLGSLATAFLLYGIALVYGAIGTTQFDGMLAKYQSLSNPPQEMIFFCGIALVTLGLAFKAAIVPFHIWAPDVYEGSPTPVTAFMVVATKAGAFIAFIRVFLEALNKFDPLWNQGIALLAYPTLIYANIVAMRQTELKRFFAYSGISHAGFLLIPIAVGTPEAVQAIIFYFIVYGLASLGAFAAIVALDKGNEGVKIEDLYGLFRRSPMIATVFALCLLTLAGIPPTVGFFAKFYIFQLAFQAGYYSLVIVALLTTIFSAYYYLRFISAMFSEETQDSTPLQISWPALTVGVSALIALVILSVYPGQLFLLFN